MSKILDWKKILGILVAVALLFLSFYKVDFRQLWTTLTSMNAGFFSIALVCAVLMNWAKGMRWRALIKRHQPITKTRVFALFHIGQMINLSLPVLTGQAGRIVMLAKQEKLSKTFCFTTVVMEVLFDGLSLIVLVYLASFLFDFPQFVRDAEIYAAIFLGLFVIVLFLALRNERYLQYLGKAKIRRRFPHLYGKLQKWVTSVSDGVKSLRSGRGVLEVSYYSLLVWAFHVGIAVMLILSLGIEVPVWAGVVVVIINSFLLMVPISPANLGSFQLAVIGALSLFKVPHAEAAAFSLVLHFLDIFPVFAIGIYFLFTKHFTFRKLREDAVREAESADCQNDLRLDKAV